jgi:hypothetical protein
MGKFNYKHIVEEIDGVRCTVVESGINEKRMEFLKNLLSVNKYEVKVEQMAKKDENELVKYKIGVTDIIFHPMIAIYERKIFTAEGLVVSPQYWFQETEEIKPYYWL